MFDWERNWRGNGIIFVVLFIVAMLIYGDQPKVGATPAELVSFYHGDRTRILIAAVIFGFAVLTLLWFAAALTGVLRDAGKGGWGTAATTASTALGTIFFVIVTMNTALAYTIVSSGNIRFAAGLNDLSWVLMVLALFPAAMLIMAGSFGLWRAGLISSAWFSAGVAAMVVLLLGTTTWAGDGFWAVDGAYARFIAPIVGLAWIAVVSGFLMRSYSAVSTPDRAAVPAA